MAWQFSSQQPIYQQIVEYITQDIFSGKYALGERLPSVRDLALVASVNPNTMQRALAELENVGLVSTQRNSGRTVTADEEVVKLAKKQRAVELAAKFMEQMQAIGDSTEDTIALLRMGNKEEKDGSDS